MNGATKFSIEDAQQAGETWGANCGPGALAAIAGMTLDEVRPHLVGFDQKHYTNPRMMFAALKSIGMKWTKPEGEWPTFGLVRVQWHGPWMNPGVPMIARYRQTHWIGTRINDGNVEIFDINCMCVGGWVGLEEWSDKVVPWLLRECGNHKADGKWSATHRLQVE